MKYFDEILKAFDSIGFKPRDNQIEYCNEVLEQFLDKKFKYCVLNAPTGSGKSILAIVISEVLHKKISLSDKNQKASFAIMGQNVLAKQYYETFTNNKGIDLINNINEIPENLDFSYRKGAENYECDFFRITKNLDATATTCLIKFLSNPNNAPTDSIGNNLDLNICNKCKYSIMRNCQDRCNHLITNYSFYFIDRLYLTRLDPGYGSFPYHMEPRTLTIFDEAHTINEMFVEHNSIHFSIQKLNDIYEDVKTNIPFPYNKKILTDIKNFTSDLYLEKINDFNYLNYLKQLHEIYNTIMELVEAQIFYFDENCDDELERYKNYIKYKRISSKYFGLGCKIDDLFVYEYEHVFDYNKENREVTVKPIFIGKMFKKLENSNYILFMSATITKEFLVKTLDLNPKEVGFVKLKSSFPKESKKAIFLSSMDLNYHNLQDNNMIKEIHKKMRKIIEFHASNDEKGIVLIPSFYLTKKLSNLFSEKESFKVFEHIQGTKLEDILNEFKEYKKPSVLLSPSLFEGLNLIDDISRYQIFVKAPYPSLAEKRMKYILKNHSSIYKFLTLLKIIQGCGRSTRSAEDYSITYMLDSHIEKLWKSKQNIWAEEFYSMFSIKK